MIFLAAVAFACIAAITAILLALIDFKPAAPPARSPAPESPQRCYVCAEPGLLFGDLCPGCAAFVHDVIGIPAHCRGKEIPCIDCTAAAWRIYKEKALLIPESELLEYLADDAKPLLPSKRHDAL